MTVSASYYLLIYWTIGCYSFYDTLLNECFMIYCRWCWCFRLVGFIYQLWVFIGFFFPLLFSNHSYLLMLVSLHAWCSTILSLYSIAECFAFLVCTKWFNPVIHRQAPHREPGSSSTAIRYLDWNSGLVVSSDDDQFRGRLCGSQDIGGHIMKIPVVAFQVLLCMRLEVIFRFVLDMLLPVLHL